MTDKALEYKIKKFMHGFTDHHAVHIPVSITRVARVFHVGKPRAKRVLEAMEREELIYKNSLQCYDDNFEELPPITFKGWELTKEERIKWNRCKFYRHWRKLAPEQRQEVIMQNGSKENAIENYPWTPGLF